MCLCSYLLFKHLGAFLSSLPLAYASFRDILDPAMDRFPEIVKRVSADGLQLPLVYVGDELFSAGGKINGPGLRHRVEEIISGVEPGQEQ